MMKKTILFLLIVFFSACGTKKKISPLFYKCIEENTFHIISINNQTVFDLFSSIEDDLLKEKILISTNKEGYLEFIRKIKNEEQIYIIRTIIKKNFILFSDYPDSVMNVGSPFYECMNKYRVELTNDEKLLLAEYQKVYVRGNFDIESLEILTNKLNYSLFNNDKDRILLLYSLTKLIMSDY